MDLHPIIVHIPVAFLSIFSIVEILSLFPKFRHSKTFFFIKFFILLVGFTTTILALMSGENAFHLNIEAVNKSLVHDHERMADMTRNIYLLIVCIYISIAFFRVEQIRNWVALKFNNKTVLRIFEFLSKVGGFFDRYYGLLILLALVGLVVVSTTGALGGAIIYGTQTKDPFINMVTKYFGY